MCDNVDPIIRLDVTALKKNVEYHEGLVRRSMARARGDYDGDDDDDDNNDNYNNHNNVMKRIFLVLLLLLLVLFLDSRPHCNS